MTETTPNLNLPYILPSQAMKHITHNEALQILDAATNAVIAATLTAPPATPVEGALYLVGASASAAFAGKDGRLAFFIDGAWIFLVPRLAGGPGSRLMAELACSTEPTGSIRWQCPSSTAWASPQRPTPRTASRSPLKRPFSIMPAITTA